MTVEAITLYTVNKAGLAEIRGYLTSLSWHEPTDETIRAYAAEIEDGLIGSEGKTAGTEIRGMHSKTGKRIAFNISDGGWDVEEI